MTFLTFVSVEGCLTKMSYKMSSIFSKIMRFGWADIIKGIPSSWKIIHDVLLLISKLLKRY